MMASIYSNRDFSVNQFTISRHQQPLASMISTVEVSMRVSEFGLYHSLLLSNLHLLYNET